MPDDHPLSVAAARTLALLQSADVVFLMGARFNWIFRFGQPPRYANDMQVIQLDIAREEIGRNKATEVGLGRPTGQGQGSSKAIVGQLKAALAGRQWLHRKGHPVAPASVGRDSPAHSAREGAEYGGICFRASALHHHSAAAGACRRRRSTFAKAIGPGQSSRSQAGSGSPDRESGRRSSSSPRPFGNNVSASRIS
jgi:hypothetical protein